LGASRSAYARSTPSATERSPGSPKILAPLDGRLDESLNSGEAADGLRLSSSSNFAWRLIVPGQGIQHCHDYESDKNGWLHRLTPKDR